VVALSFETKAASVHGEIRDGALIDSGATHHFFYRSSFVRNYQQIHAEVVVVASMFTQLIEKGEAWIPLNGGM